MKGTDTCGYVIRYGSSGDVSPCDVGGNSRVPDQSLFINRRTCHREIGPRVQGYSYQGLRTHVAGVQGVNTSRAEHASQ